MSAPLDPRGTLRARHAGGTEAVFRRLGLGARKTDLGDEGLYLAEEIVRADPWVGDAASREALGVLVLALMIVQRQGSTRLPLEASAKGPLRTLIGEIARAAELDDAQAKAIFARIRELVHAPGFDSVIGTGDARRPLVVDDGCLYSERSRTLEDRVAARLAERLRQPRVSREAPPDDRTSTPPFGGAARSGEAGASDRLTLEQRRAVEVALSGAIAVVTGGPGTGKTLVAAAIVRGLRAAGIAHVALAAPTGKAANRLTEVMASELGPGAPTAQTLHRLLGVRGNSLARRAHALPIGALVVDEASMLDLELADAMLAALPPTAPLVLIGDAHQLPAVDAGRILADLADPDGPAAAHVAWLEHSHRMNAGDPRGRAVLELARAIHAGDAAPLLEKPRQKTPGTLAFEGIEWVDAAGKPGATAREIAEHAWHHFGGPQAHDAANATVFRFAGGDVAPEQAAELAHLWNIVGRARILTATRSTPTGSIALNAYLHERALSRMSVSGAPDFVPGEPIMVTANDYQRGLFNGDQGIVIRADEGAGGHRYRALFRIGERLVPFAIEALRDRLELAWALTIHKSQGSELDAVAIVLPDEDLPIVTRELLYTGITRARKSVAVCAPRDVVVRGAKRAGLRYSGLGARISRNRP